MEHTNCRYSQPVEMRYYYKKDREILGPLEIRELIEVADRDTLVRAEFGMAEYVPMHQTTIEEDYEVLLLEGYNASLCEPQPVDKPVNTKKVAGTLSLAGGFAILFHLIHVAGALNHDSNTLNAIPVTSFTILDSNGRVLHGDPLPAGPPTDTLTTAEAMKLINENR